MNNRYRLPIQLTASSVMVLLAAGALAQESADQAEPDHVAPRRMGVSPDRQSGGCAGNRCGAFQKLAARRRRAPIAAVSCARRTTVHGSPAWAAQARAAS